MAVLKGKYLKLKMMVFKLTLLMNFKVFCIFLLLSTLKYNYNTFFSIKYTLAYLFCSFCFFLYDMFK